MNGPLAKLQDAVQRILDADREAPDFGLADCCDNDGERYQSADLAAALLDARKALADLREPKKVEHAKRVEIVDRDALVSDLRKKAKQRPSDGLIERQSLSERDIEMIQVGIDSCASHIAALDPLEQCSFCFLPATTEVDDESGLMGSFDKCAAAWKLNPGFVKEDAAAADDEGGARG